MFSPDLVDKGVTFSDAAASGHCFCVSRCHFAVIYDYGKYFEIIFSVSHGHVEKDPSLIAWIRVLWLVSRRCDGKKPLSLSGMMGDMLWGAVSPLFYCGCISVTP